jgi:hypothetical protein
MRFDMPIYFQSIKKGEYNAKTGDYEPDVVTEVKTYADVTDAREDAITLIYGKLKQGAKVVRLLRPLPVLMSFDRIRIGDKLYIVDFSRRKKAFYVSEVQENAGHNA